MWPKSRIAGAIMLGVGAFGLLAVFLFWPESTPSGKSPSIATQGGGTGGSQAGGGGGGAGAPGGPGGTYIQNQINTYVSNAPICEGTACLIDGVATVSCPGMQPNGYLCIVTDGPNGSGMGESVTFYKTNAFGVDGKSNACFTYRCEATSPTLPASVMSPTATVQPAICPDFKAVYDSHHKELGAPIAACDTTAAYWAIYQHADVLWLENVLSFYVLPTTLESKWIVQRDPDWSTDPDLYDEAKAKQRFHPPAGVLAPLLGIANHWQQLKQLLGWRIWDCARGHNRVYYQEFENGFMVGTLGLSLNKYTEGEIIVLLNDHSWFSRLAPSIAPRCD